MIVMNQWCSNCRSSVSVLQGKNEVSICYDCGCELSYRPIEPLKTVALFESLINFDSGLARYPGEFANAESNLEAAPEIELDTTRFLPSGIFDVSARDIELDERWHAEQLLERINQLEQTFQIAESLLEQVPIDEIAFNAVNGPIDADGSDVNAGNRDLVEEARSAIDPKSRSVVPVAGSKPLLRIDRGHVATPDQIRLYNEQKSHVNSSGGDRSPLVGTPSNSDRNGNTNDLNDDVKPTFKYRIDTSHQAEIPMARPISEPLQMDGAQHRIDATGLETTRDRANWTIEARQFTCAAMATAWIIQLVIGTVVVSNGPLAIWSFWLIAQTVGTICLGRIGWQLLGQRDSDARFTRNVPRPSVISSTHRRNVIKH